MDRDDEFDGVIRRYAMAMTAQPADGNPHMPNPADGMSHWACTLTADRGDPLEVVCSMDHTYGGEPPTLPLVLSFVCEDVRSYRACDGFATWARRLGLDVFGDADQDEVGRWRGAYEEIGRLSVGLDELLGAEASADLVGEDLRALPGAEAHPSPVYAPRP